MSERARDGCFRQPHPSGRSAQSASPRIGEKSGQSEEEEEFDEADAANLRVIVVFGQEESLTLHSSMFLSKYITKALCCRLISALKGVATGTLAVSGKSRGWAAQRRVRETQARTSCCPNLPRRPRRGPPTSSSPLVCTHGRLHRCRPELEPTLFRTARSVAPAFALGCRGR